MSPRQRIILHADMDAFFASVEQRDNPHYKNKPVIVGAAPGSRGVVSAASYEARIFGVRSAMPISEAYRRCPQGVFVRPRMAVYAAESEKIMEILGSFSPLVEPVSVDEAFVDISGTQKLRGDPLQCGRAIAQTVADTCGLSVSIGIAPNKFLAKIASDLNKPRGLTMAPFSSEEILAWLAPMPVSRIWGVGPKTQQMFARIGVHTIGDLQRMSADQLGARFGKSGHHLYDLCRGIDFREVCSFDEIKSISREHTFAADSGDRRAWLQTLLRLARDVASRARAHNLKGATVVLTYRTPDFKRSSRQVTLAQPTNTARKMYSEAKALLETASAHFSALRLIGIGITNFSDTSQTDLFMQLDKEEAWEASESAMDTIARRYGDGAIFLGGEISGPPKPKRNIGRTGDP